MVCTNLMNRIVRKVFLCIPKRIYISISPAADFRCVIATMPYAMGVKPSPWWRHQMDTFSALLAFCAGNSPVPGEFPSQRPVTWSFNVFYDLHLNKRLSKQSWGWWFETPLRPLWHHCNVKAPVTRVFRCCFLLWQKGPMMWKAFPCHDAIMSQWCIHREEYRILPYNLLCLTIYRLIPHSIEI